jgi:hypothetical protein
VIGKFFSFVEVYLWFAYCMSSKSASYFPLAQENSLVDITPYLGSAARLVLQSLGVKFGTAANHDAVVSRQGMLCVPSSAAAFSLMTTVGAVPSPASSSAGGNTAISTMPPQLLPMQCLLISLSHGLLLSFCATVLPVLTVYPEATLFSTKAAVFFSLASFICFFIMCLIRYYISNRVNICHALSVHGYWRLRIDVQENVPSPDSSSTTAASNQTVVKFSEGRRYFQGDIVKVVTDRSGKLITEPPVGSSASTRNSNGVVEEYYELLSPFAIPIHYPTTGVSEQLGINRFLQALFGHDFGVLYFPVHSTLPNECSLL